MLQQQAHELAGEWGAWDIHFTRSIASWYHHFYLSSLASFTRQGAVDLGSAPVVPPIPRLPACNAAWQFTKICNSQAAPTVQYTACSCSTVQSLQNIIQHTVQPTAQYTAHSTAYIIQYSIHHFQSNEVQNIH